MNSYSDDVDALLKALGPFEQVRVNHHWVPVTYLKPFVGGDGQLYMWDRKALAQPKRVSPVAVAKERKLYTIEGQPPAPDLVERLLDRAIEVPFALARNKLVYGPEVGLYPSFAPGEQLALSLFLAVQQGRTPFARDTANWLASFHASFTARARLEDIEAVVQEVSRKSGRAVSSAEVEEWRDQMDAGELEIHPAGPQWLAIFLKQAMELAPAIAALPWRLVLAPPGLTFPTTDLPVVLARREPQGLGYVLGGGWLDPETEMVIALSPRHLFVVGKRVESDLSVGSDAWCVSARERIIRHSERFVFATSRESDVLSILSDSRPPYPVVTIDGREYPMRGPVGPLVRKAIESEGDVLRFGVSTAPRDWSDSATRSQ